MMEENKLKKIFGVGPTGAAVTLLMLVLFVWLDAIIGHPVIMDNAILMKTVGVLLIVLGLGLHGWSYATLRSWWSGDQLCTRGPFRYFRHPMYAAWITFVCPGVALYRNAWVYLVWILMIHPFWHALVRKEETTMTGFFGDAYREYARETGRFVPRWL